jgi:hypothetical protein
MENRPFERGYGGNEISRAEEKTPVPLVLYSPLGNTNCFDIEDLPSPLPHPLSAISVPLIPFQSWCLRLFTVS